MFPFFPLHLSTPLLLFLHLKFVGNTFRTFQSNTPDTQCNSSPSSKVEPQMPIPLWAKRDKSESKGTSRYQRSRDSSFTTVRTFTRQRCSLTTTVPRIISKILSIDASPCVYKTSNERGFVFTKKTVGTKHRIFKSFECDLNYNDRENETSKETTLVSRKDTNE